MRTVPLSLLLILLAACTAREMPGRAITESVIESASIGYRVVSLADGRVVTEQAPDRAFIPASTVKVLTAMAVRDALPAAHRFATRLCADGPPDAAGRVAGDLVLVGGGDPTLDFDDLLGLALKARAAGLRSVGGRFLVDDGALPWVGAIARAQPPDAVYNPPLSALGVAENAQRLEWRADGRAWFVPKPDDAVGGTREAAAGAAARKTPAGHEWLPVARPSLRTGALFRRFAGAAGLALPEPERELAGCAHAIARVESAPRDAVLAEMLKRSSNPMAELLGLAASRARGERPETLARAARGTEAWLARILPASDLATLRLPNHSGLDAAARATPRQMVEALAYAYARDGDGRPFASLLTPGGWAGALRPRFADPSTALKIWAKTGTMHYGVGLVGYLFDVESGVYAFALYASDFEKRRAYDAVAADPPDDVERTAEAWDTAARAALDAILIDSARRIAATCTGESVASQSSSSCR